MPAVAASRPRQALQVYFSDASIRMRRAQDRQMKRAAQSYAVERQIVLSGF